MLRIAVVEDDKACSDLLKEYIDRFCKQSGEQARVAAFGDGIDIASDYAAEYDIIFLDIVMKHMDGLKTAEYIRKKDKNVIIVFVSSDARFAVNGYSVEALSFMVKPVTYPVFSKEMGRCVEKIKNGRGKYVVLTTENGIDKIAVDKIIYIESQNHKMLINTTEKPYCVYETMKSLEGRLPKDQFSRCNNCYLVNLDFVKGVHGEYALVNGEELKISRSRRKGFIDDISSYYFCG